MTVMDKLIQCSDCGTTFTFSAAEQELFVSIGYDNEPQRCSWCRAARKMKSHRDSNYSYRSRSWRQMFGTTYAQSGKDTRLSSSPTKVDVDIEANATTGVG